MAIFHFTITQVRIFVMKKYKIFNYPSKIPVVSAG